jgi:predicted metal-dependent phosphoesterase TrpH
LIDLHTHTTASDGRCTPEDLAARASTAGVTVLAVTDHDTVAGCAAAAAACERLGIGFVNGIEITAVTPARELHVLGYFVDVESPGFETFLATQRQRRVERTREMIARLATCGLPLDVDAILGPGLSDTGRAVGRPWIARALVERGYVGSVNEAFDRWLGRGKPAFVPRTGADAEAVIARIHDAGGIASLAHPVLIGDDEVIPKLAAAGLDALEAYHSDHDRAATARYLARARELGLLVTGGSDFHGDAGHGGAPGSASLPREEFARLTRRAQR